MASVVCAANNSVEYFMKEFFKSQDVVEQESEDFIFNLNEHISKGKKEIVRADTKQKRFTRTMSSLSIKDNQQARINTTKLEFEANEMYLKSKQTELEALMKIKTISTEYITTKNLKTIKLDEIKSICLFNYNLYKDYINPLNKMDQKEAIHYLSRNQNSNGSWDMDLFLYHCVQKLYLFLSYSMKVSLL
jgi:hypothetical protein